MGLLYALTILEWYDILNLLSSGESYCFCNIITHIEKGLLKIWLGFGSSDRLRELLTFLKMNFA